MASTQPNDLPITLCLSGGGLRASLFHLGLIKALRHHDIGGRPALSLVDDIYSVSGGTIIAAHLISRWDDYLHGDFAKVEREMIAFARRNLRDRVVRRWLMTFWAGGARTFWLQQELRALIGGGSFAGAYAGKAIPPELHIMTTSFRTGDLCAITKDSFTIIRRQGGQAQTQGCATKEMALAFATAASSAFPPLFPPVRLKPGQLAPQKGQTGFDDILPLSDGGVYDNLGLEWLLQSGVPGLGRLLVSNAGASFNAERGRQYTSALSRNSRASDIMMRRVGDMTEASMAELQWPAHHKLRIGEAVPGSHLSKDAQYHLRLVRTDLDAFDPGLCAMLIDHGYQAGVDLLGSIGAVPPAAAPRLLSAELPPARADEIAERAGKRRYWPFLFGFGDWMSFPQWVIPVLVLFAGISAFKEYRESQKLAKVAEQAAAEIGRQQKSQQDMAKLIGPIQKAYAEGNDPALRFALARAAKAANLTLRPRAEAEPQRPPPARQGRYRQRVYLQFAGDVQRIDTLVMIANMRSAGWNMQDSDGGEYHPSTKGVNKVLFRPGNEAAAAALADAVTASGISTRVVPEARPNTGANVLEVYLSK